MTIATVLASGATALPRLTRLRIVPLLGCLLLLISGMTLLYMITDSWLRRGERIPVVTSPDAAYRAYTRPEGFVAAMPPAIYVGPRYAPKIWFSARVAEGYEPHWLDNQHLSYSPDSTTKFLQRGRYLQVQGEPTIKNSKYPTQSGYR